MDEQDNSQNKRRSFNELLRVEEDEAEAADSAPVAVAAPEAAEPAYPPMPSAPVTRAAPEAPASEEGLRPGLERKSLPPGRPGPTDRHVELVPIAGKGKKRSSSPTGPIVITIVLLLAGALAFWVGARSGGGSDLPSAGLTELTPAPVDATATEEPSPAASNEPEESPTAAADPEPTPSLAASPDATPTEPIAATPDSKPTEPVAATPDASPTPDVKPTRPVAATPTPDTVAVLPAPAAGVLSVSVKSNVKDAEILLYRGKERLKGKTSVSPTSTGTYTLKVTAPGYKPYVKEVKVTGKHNLAVYLKPEPAPVYQAPSYDPGPSYYDPGPSYYPSGGGGGGGGGGYEIPAGGL
ncbi:PEGA domain-containing protein [bacterium CPR1]|nr:PEGA domain-containing protein [bacterium CPR1]